MHDYDEVDVIRHEADKSVQEKAGTGRISMKRVDNLDKALNNNKLDFKSNGLELLDQLEGILSRAAGMDLERLKSEITVPVLTLAGSAEMFKYKLVGDLATVMLNFLEQIDRVDDDVIAIIGSHHKTLKAILLKDMKGDGGKQGKILKSELLDVCERYKKHHKRTVN